jgi:hypothetical protein
MLSALFYDDHFRLPFSLWERALPAAVLLVREVRPSRRVLLAARAARGLVTFLAILVLG